MTAALMLERLMRLAKARGTRIVLAIDPTEPNPERWTLQLSTGSACGDASDGGDIAEQLDKAIADFEKGILA